MKTCAFTGHRPQHLPFGMNENDDRCVKLKKALKATLESSVVKTVNLFMNTNIHFAEQRLLEA